MTTQIITITDHKDNNRHKQATVLGIMIWLWNYLVFHREMLRFERDQIFIDVSERRRMLNRHMIYHKNQTKKVQAVLWKVTWRHKFRAKNTEIKHKSETSFLCSIQLSYNNSLELYKFVTNFRRHVIQFLQQFTLQC